MILHAIAALSLATLAAALSVFVLMQLASADPDKTVGGAYAALAMMVAPLVFIGALGLYAFGVWIWKG